MALTAASRGSVTPDSSWRYTFSTTMIESSTTRPIASTSPSSVSVLIEKPKIAIIAKGPMIETGIAIMGISVARKLCRKMKIVTSTRMPASIRVFTRSSSDASTKSVVS